MTFKQALSFTKKELEKKIPNFQQESQWILEHILKKSYSYLIAEDSLVLSEKEEKTLQEFVQLRLEEQPLQYLLGEVEFKNLSFKTCKEVLIPREETEILVDFIEQKAKPQDKILEIGVGSGIISIALKYYRKDLQIEALDINPKALDCSLKNAENLLGKNHNLNLYESDLFESVKGQFDFIVSNPPYLTKEEWQENYQELKYEPIEALVTPQEGLAIYKRIAKEAKLFLKEKGKIVLEISPFREEALKKIFLEHGYFLLEDLKDSFNILRGVVFEKM